MANRQTFVSVPLLSTADAIADEISEARLMMPPIFWIATEPTGRLHIIDLWTDLDSLKPSATDEANYGRLPAAP